MNNPDIKIAHINIAEKLKNPINKALVHEVVQRNVNHSLKIYFRFQQEWVNRAYKVFNDFDTYIILIYLFNKVYQNYSDRFHYMSMDAFFEQEQITIDKLNLIEISKDLNIPKETVRRKINYLQSHDIIARKGKIIYINNKALEIQKPTESINGIASVLANMSNYLAAEEWFGESVPKEKIVSFIHEHFTVCWEYFYRFQIPYLIRHRSYFGDVESWNVWGSIGLVQIRSLIQESENALEKPALKSHLDFYLAFLKHKAKRGINASSISDISSIPRATVIRKLKSLEKNKHITRNKKLEYSIGNSREDIKGIEKNYLTTQEQFSGYVTTMFNLMKHSKFNL